MVQAYLNYPNKRFIIHHKSDCTAIRQHTKKNQRVVLIDKQNISDELIKFENGKYKFCPIAAFNDMWLKIELDDSRYEEETILHIHKLLSSRYSRLKDISYCKNCGLNK